MAKIRPWYEAHQVPSHGSTGYHQQVLSRQLLMLQMNLLGFGPGSLVEITSQLLSHPGRIPVHSTGLVEIT